MSEGNPIQKIVRKTASSGKVDYAPPKVLHETSRSRLEALAWFIRRSDGTEFNLKLIGQKRKQNGPWMQDDTKTLTLSEVSSLELYNFLRTHLPIASRQEGGEYLLIRVANGEANLEGHDPSELANALTRVLSQPDLVDHLSNTELTHELAGALRTSVRLTEMRAAVAQLRAHLQSGTSDESVYQEWCEKHCWAFGNAYVVRDDVRQISTGDKVDLLLPGVIAGYRDIVELKRPDMDVLNYDRTHRNFYFTSEVSKAVGQCHRYLDMLHEAARNGLLDHKEVVAYHPRAVIVIGRSHDWTEDEQRALHGLNGRLHGISVTTYDHLLAQGERLIDVLRPGGREQQDAECDDTDSLDDIPFW